MLAVAAAVVSSAQADLANGIRAIVHDSVITYEDVEELIPELLFRQYRTQPDVLQQKLEQARNENLEYLVARQLILHDFKTAGYNIPESILDDEVENRIRSRYTDRVKFVKSLQAEGSTQEKFRQRIREQIIEAALRQKNVSSEIIISPHKVESYYLEHRDDFKEENRVKLRMIMLNKSTDPEAPSAQKLAEEILGKLKEGASFAEMASVYSQESYRSQGGDHGWMEQKDLRKELAEAAAALKPGETSGIIETPEACWLMLVEEKSPTHIKSLSEVREDIDKALKAKERDRLEKQYIERLKKKTFVRYF
jgi:peptidyl-prolyl cis-trans isomerase SurA